MSKDLISKVRVAFDNPALVCPVCQFNYVHPVALECFPPGKQMGRLLVNHEGIHLDPREEPSARGVEITLRFTCESGHSFSYQFKFHKGQTFVKRTISSDDGECRTIWRN